MRVCVALGIPFREIDLSAEYQKDVVESMIADYARGITPNPDVLCNRHIKFGAFARWALKEGADMIATGHYARVRSGGDHSELLRAKDLAKDQSYFLYRLDQKILPRVIFPVGDLLKSQVRDLAKRYDLPVAAKPDSQGLCFVGEVSMPEFLSRFISLTNGPVEEQGKKIGTHQGVALYTVGQRHGFEVEGSATSRGPFYVIAIDVASNTLHVSSKREDAARGKAALSDEHWIGDTPSLPARFEVQARYHENPVFATIAREQNILTAVFDEPHLASPGQSLVLYKGESAVGGAIIAS
jgi:tRNA-specific 2-thiouridylase